MSEMEEKLGAILNNPQMMQQIMSMAQAINASQPQKEEPQKPPTDPPPSFPQIDPNMLRSLSNMAGQGSVDQNQQALLKALSPYLSQNRVRKLERAMRAAKMAGLASSFLNSGALQLLSGR